jgi:hypothetical protein
MNDTLQALCYRGTVHGFTSTAFHTQCDLKGLQWELALNVLFIIILI